jgi:hypothetical protein
VSSDQEIRLNAVLDWLEKGHITTTTQAAALVGETRAAFRRALTLGTGAAETQPESPGRPGLGS